MRLDQILSRMDEADIAQLLEALEPDNQLLIWARLGEDVKEHVLRDIPLSVLQVLGKTEYNNEQSNVKAFELIEGRLRAIPISSREDWPAANPIWIDMVEPAFEDRIWVGEIFGLELPDPDKLGDLESSCLLYTSPSPRDRQKSRMPSSA